MTIRVTTHKIKRILKRFDFNCFGLIFQGLRILFQLAVALSTVVIQLRIGRVSNNGSGVGLHSLLVVFTPSQLIGLFLEHLLVVEDHIVVALPEPEDGGIDIIDEEPHSVVLEFKLFSKYIPSTFSFALSGESQQSAHLIASECSHVPLLQLYEAFPEFLLDVELLEQTKTLGLVLRQDIRQLADERLNLAGQRAEDLLADLEMLRPLDQRIDLGGHLVPGHYSARRVRFLVVVLAQEGRAATALPAAEARGGFTRRRTQGSANHNVYIWHCKTQGNVFNYLPIQQRVPPSLIIHTSLFGMESTQHHSEDLTIAHKTKPENYESILAQILSLADPQLKPVSNHANIVAALKEQFNWWWVGFYFVDKEELYLGPFQGPVACTKIKFGKGVCGASWKQKQTIVVPNVEEFPGHIACSSKSKSEIVVPILKNGEVVGVLDVDSEHLAHFDETDKKYLEDLIAKLVNVGVF